MVDTYLEEFSETYNISDKTTWMYKAVSLSNKWIKECESTKNIKIRCTNMGIDARNTICCKKRRNEVKVKQQLTRYEGTNYQDTPQNTENCSWFVTNLRLVLGILAAGMGSSEVLTLYSFIEGCLYLFPDSSF